MDAEEPRGEEVPRSRSRRPAWWRRWLVRPLAWVLTIVVALAASLPLVVRTEWVREAVRTRVAEQASLALERDLSIGSVRLRLFPLSIELSDVILAGPVGEPPTLTVAKALVEIDAPALLGKELRLERVALEQPHLAMRFDAEGDSLPHPPTGAAGEPAWSVALDLVEVHGGIVDLEETTLPLELAARQVEVEAVGSGGLGLRGHVDVGQIDLEVAGLDPVAVTVRADFTLSDSALHLREASLQGPGVDARVLGVVETAQPSSVGLEVDAQVDASLGRALGVFDDELDGEARLRGTFEWSGVSWGARATVDAPRIVAAGVEVAGLEGRLAADRGRIVLDVDRAELWDGRFVGRVAYDPQAARGGSLVVESRLEQVSLSALMARVGVPLQSLDGRVSGPLELALDVDDWERMVGRAALVASTREPRLGVLAGRVDVMVGRGNLDLAWTLESPRHRVAGGGRLGLPDFEGDLQIGVNTTELGALLAALPWTVEGDWWPNAGRGRLDVEVGLRGSTAVRLAVDLVDAAAPGWRADHVAGVVELSETAAERIRLEAQLGDGAVLIRGEAPFDDRPLSLRFEAANWPALELRPWLPGSPPVGGIVTGSLDLRGAGDGLEGEVDATVVGPSWSSWAVGGQLLARVGFGDMGVRIDRAELDVPAGCLVASGTVGEAEELDLVVEATNLDLARMPLSSWLGRELPIRGAARARLTGTVSEPSVELALNAEAPQGSAVADLSYSGGTIELDATLPGGVHLNGGGPLAASGANVTFDLEASELAPMTRMLGLPEVDGEMRGRLGVQLDAAGSVSAHVDLSQLELLVGSNRLVALEPVQLAFEQGTLALESFYLGSPGGGSDLFVGGSIGVEEGTLDLVVQGSAELALLEQIAGSSFGSKGRAEVLTTVRGTIEAPRWRGQGAVRAERVTLPGLGSPIEEMTADILLDPGAVVLDQAVGRVASGAVRVQGRVELEGLAPAFFRAQARAQDLALRLRPGLTVIGDAELVWSGGPEQSAITGRVDLERVSYVETIETDPLRLLRSALQHQRLQVASADEALAAVQLSIGVIAPGTIRVRNNLARFDASADLVVRGTLARPTVFGRAQSIAGGSFEYSGNTYEIERGVVSFVDPLEIDPSLDLLASTRVGAYNVSLSVGGTLERLELSFASDPPLPDLEVLALVAGGEGAAERLASAADGGVQTGLRTQAESLLLGQAAALLERRVGTLFGLDSIQIEPLTTGGETLSSARVTVGRQINSRLRATYSWDPSSTEQQRLRVEWVAGEGWTLVLTQNGDGTYSVDSRWEKRF